MSLTSDVVAMLADQLAQGEAESVTYVPHRGIPKTITMLISREPASLEFSGGAETPVIEYAGFLANDAVLGVTCVTDQRDEVHAKKLPSDTANAVFRVVSHRTDTGGHSIRMKL